ncbi:Ni/Fe hydrogenase subunit alpha [Thiorhodococcus minor]|uniref:Ni/Fe hydrogenase subunit alpha n=1 Tax=Thiorhodococcus minor TaxID=57489 RepID=A0A6M0K6F0_9GAMM|nr:Ni/Fe hydrogenase subunit alpha [Thiorhodococcus minor]NEV64177.1 Ni/Fe hydrogenase subunit alpha [Thiorhodococcus minor]
MTESAQTGTRVIQVDALARVEGEGALYLKVKDGAIEDLKFRIYEPPRFFEALLEGRDFSDAPDITARICGICPMAYLLSACQAMEDAAGVSVTGPLRDLRRLAYCGEWIESHVLHAFLLHAPDFLGHQDAIALAKDHPEAVRKALALKKAGNAILEVIGGRAVHPVNFRVGGLHSVPRRSAIEGLEAMLASSLETAIELTRFTAGLTFPDFEDDYLSVSLRHPDEYAIHEGRIVSSAGLDIPVSAFEEHFTEEHVDHSNALQGLSKTSATPYLVGPVARYNNNQDQLSPLARELAAEIGLGEQVTNPFRSIQVRMIETVYAFEEALRLVRAYEEPEVAAVPVQPKSTRGAGCTEAPRGICYHSYDLDAEGRILTARIVPPTSQNQRRIERDLRGVAERHLSLPDAELQWVCEQAIRNYDPCISCATHFLKLTVERV